MCKVHVLYTYLLICFVQGACLSFIVLSNVLSRHGQIILCYVLYSTHVFQSVMSRSHASKSFLYNLPSMCFSVSFLQGTVHLPCNQFCARYGTCALPFNQFCANQVFKKVINLLSHCKILKNMFTRLHNVSNLAKY